jgi:hypothetical protein
MIKKFVLTISILPIFSFVYSQSKNTVLLLGRVLFDMAKSELKEEF